MADEKSLPPHIRAVGLAGGASFLILAWVGFAIFYALASVLVVMLGNAVHAVALLLVSVRQAEFLWWLACFVMMIGLTYGMRLAIEYIGEQTGDPSQTDPARLAAAIRRAGRGPRAVEPHELPVTGPSPAEIERNRVR